MKTQQTSGFFVIRQKSTGFLFPRTGRGSTWAEFQKHCSPRLFTTNSAAKNCLAWWLCGATKMTVLSSYDGEPDWDLHTETRPNRKASDYEIVAVTLQFGKATEEES